MFVDVFELETAWVLSMAFSRSNDFCLFITNGMARLTH